MKIIDTHSHFNLEQFDADRPEAIERMRQASIGTICIGIDLKTSILATQIAEANHDIWATVGIHPTHWGVGFNHDQLSTLAKKEKVVAIGECGLDYFREEERRAKPEQKVLFKSHIELARELDLPLMLHVRPERGSMDAYEEAFLILQEARLEWANMRGTVHFFQGTQEIAQRFINLGFHISFSGIITIFPEYEEIVLSVPLDRILPETDSPFAAPIPYRGERNEPVYVLEIVKKIAQIKNLPIEEVEIQLLKNVKTLFSI